MRPLPTMPTRWSSGLMLPPPNPFRQDGRAGSVWAGTGKEAPIPPRVSHGLNPARGVKVPASLPPLRNDTPVSRYALPVRGMPVRAPAAQPKRLPAGSKAAVPVAQAKEPASGSKAAALAPQAKETAGGSKTAAPAPQAKKPVHGKAVPRNNMARNIGKGKGKAAVPRPVARAAAPSPEPPPPPSPSSSSEVNDLKDEDYVDSDDDMD